MIICNILGGIGNQMFQYAAGRSLSLKTNQQLKLDLNDFSKYRLHNGYELNRVFNICTEYTNQSTLDEFLAWRANHLARRVLRQPKFSWFRGNKFVQEPYFNYWPDFFNLHGDCYLSGYWQSEHYFKPIEKLIRTDFTFKETLAGQNLELATEMTNSPSVSIHVRRGDYISNPKNQSLLQNCTLEYYNKAISHLTEKIDNPTFYIFSDDIPWVIQNLNISFPSIYVNHNLGADSYKDMQLMSLCQHHIIANSSFSWWGAWLNPNPEKIVVAPELWFVNQKYNTKDLIPSNWIKLK